MVVDITVISADIRVLETSIHHFMMKLLPLPDHLSPLSLLIEYALARMTVTSSNMDDTLCPGKLAFSKSDYTSFPATFRSTLFLKRFRIGACPMSSMDLIPRCGSENLGRENAAIATNPVPAGLLHSQSAPPARLLAAASTLHPSARLAATPQAFRGAG